MNVEYSKLQQYCDFGVSVECVMVWSCLGWHSWRCGRSLSRRQDCVSRQYRDSLFMLYVVDDGCHGECGMRDRWKEEPCNCIEIYFWSPSDFLSLWFWCVTFSLCCWWHFDCCRRLVFWLWLYQDRLDLMCASWRWNLANWILFITYDINICFMHLADLGLMLDDGARPTFW